jgi:hypothetical protein
MRSPCFPSLFLLTPPETFFGVPSLVSNAEYYWLIKETEKKTRQIKKKWCLAPNFRKNSSRGSNFE